MASNISKIPVLRRINARSFASAQSVPVGGNPCFAVNNLTLPNKLVVTSTENDSAISRISIVFRAGSRYETSDNFGVTHALRVCAGIATQNASQFAIIRNIQQVGASLTAKTTRETISYTLEGTRSAIERSIPFLTEVATQQVFKPWEVADQVQRMRVELAARPPQLRVIDLVHKAAFRYGLGNSLYSAKYNLGKHSSETLKLYCNENFKTGRCAVIGVGVDHCHLLHYANGIDLPSGVGSCTPSPYKGGEIRSDKGGDCAYVAIAGEGAALEDKQALAFAVLQRALGVGPQVYAAQHDNGVLSRAIGQNTNYAVSSFNVNYSETGLFGVLIAVPCDTAGKVVEKAVAVLKGANIPEKDVNRAKNQLITDLLLRAESGAKVCEQWGEEAILLGAARDINDIVAAVGCVSAADVNAALKKAGCGKLSIASVGNLINVPFLSDLK